MNPRTAPVLMLMLLLASLGQAQTRKIGHRSHSGSRETYAMLMGEDHLGGPPLRLPAWDLQDYQVQNWVDSIKRKYPPSLDAENLPQREPTWIKDSLDKQGIPSYRPPQKQNVKGKDRAAAAQSNRSMQETPAPSAGSTILRASMPSGSSSLGILFALLLFPIAPAVFLLSAVWNNQNKNVS